MPRGASEADIKKAYRKLAKELHPDRTRTIPRRPSASPKVTQAYDILTDKDKRAQFDRGEIDEDGNPRDAVRLRRRRRRRPGGGGGGFRGPNGEPFEFGGGEAADLSDLFEGLFGGAAAAAAAAVRRLRPAQRAAAEGRRRRLPARRAVRGRGARSSGQRITLGSGKTLDLKLPPGVEDGTKIRLAGQGQPGPAGNGDAIVTIAIKPHRFFRATATISGSTCRSRLDEAVLGAKVRVPTVDGPVMLSVPKGSSSGKVLRLKGKGFTGKDGQRGDQLVTLMVDVPDDAGARQPSSKAGAARGKANPRAGLGV